MNDICTISFLAFFVVLSQIQLMTANTDLKCLVCEKVVDEIISAIEKENPRKKIQVGSFRIEPDGSQRQSEVKYAGSEIHIHEILDNVCDSLNDYAQAKNKETGQRVLLKLSQQVDMLSTHELIPDPDLNRSLKYNCESLIGDFEDEILKILYGSSKAMSQIAKLKLCKETTNFCKVISGSDESSDTEKMDHGEL